MVLSHLLQVKSRPHLPRVGPVNLTKWSCNGISSSSNSEAEKLLWQSKKPIQAKEHKAADVESFVAKFMFSEALCAVIVQFTDIWKHIKGRNNVGGSWYTVKEILTNLKGKMTGNPQLQNHSTGEISDSTVDVTSSEVTRTHKSEDISELGEVKGAVMNSKFNNDNALSSSASGMLREYSSENMINAIDFESVQTCNYNNSELFKFKSIVQSSTSLVNSGNNEKSGTNPISHILEEYSSADSVFLEASKVVEMHKSLNGHQNHQPETEITTLSKTLNAGSEVGGKHSEPFGGPEKIMGMADLLTMMGETTGERNDSVTPDSPDFLNEATGRGGKENYDILGLLDCIREMPKEKSNHRSHNSITHNKKDQSSKKAAIKGMQCEANLQRSDNKGRNTPLNGHTMVKETNNMKESEDIEGSDANTAAFDSIKSKPSREIPLPTSKQDLEKTWNALSDEKGSNDNKVLLRFLPIAAKRSEIDSLFNDCGGITRVEFHSKGGFFKIACIYFKTKEGMQTALKKTGLVLRYINLIVEPACSMDNITNKTLIPNLIGYPEVPVSLVKNPTRTVMIKQLTPDINSHDIEEALSYSGSKISGFCFGSSTSVAYVELETEEAKQMVLERHSISVSGKQLQIFRIDAPRTTVVRISNLYYPEVQNKIGCICGSYGRVKQVVVRSKEIVDVHFNLTEWPNMLRIVNRLNGLQVLDRKWIAQPAPVFPPEVLHVLWKYPDERRHLKTQIHSLLKKLVEYPIAHRVGLASMTNEYYSRA